MTTAIRYIEDLFRVLDDDPEQLEELRRRVLGPALLNLPERFDRFVAEQTRFNDDQRSVNEEQRRFNEEQRRFNGEQQQFNDEQQQFNDEMRQFHTEQLRFNARMDRFVVEQVRFNDEMRQFREETRQDLAQLKGGHARSETMRRGHVIARRMGLRRARTLTGDDLVDLTAAADTSGIAPQAIDSFVDADLVMEATDGDGQTVYIAVEISYTANRRDTGRAMRNAEFLTRFTGQPARAAVASIRNDPEIADLIGGGQVYWHEIRDRDLEPE